MGQAESHAADAGGPGATQAAGSGGQDKDAVEFLTQALSFGSCTAPCKGPRNVSSGDRTMAVPGAPSAGSRDGVKEPALPLGWEERWSSTRQRKYYYNLEKGTSTWNHPVSSRLVPDPTKPRDRGTCACPGP
eukprot:Tamp_25398.p1 GENE.Tamp_25398~~Tamp_25398.p1  ORF type:complete len:132 (+),score=17.05 Tamp_25398:123-518(+)